MHINDEEVPHGRARRVARALRLGLLLALCVNCYTACAARAVPPRVADAPPPPATSTAPDTKAAPQLQSIGAALVPDEELTYEGYTVEKWSKTVREEEAPGGRVEVAYAVLARRGRVVRSFDAGVYNGGFGNSIAFGLFPFLGGATKQLVISQDAPRAGAQWVVSLSPRPRVIYDGPAFAAGREAEEMRVADLNGDGVYEIVVPVCHFYGFRDRAMSDTPFPSAVFKYDVQAGKYLPANSLFREHLLKDVAEARSKVHGPESGAAHAADVLAVVLEYVYAGDDRAAWEFYETTYGLPDKVQLKSEIETALRAEPVYRYTHRRRAAS